MEIDRSTVPGSGVLHRCRSRSGHSFGILAGAFGRELVVYTGPDADEPLRVIALELDEADQLAEMLHSRPILDRLADVERRLGELTPDHRSRWL